MTVVIHYADPDTGLFVGKSWMGPHASVPQRGRLRAVDVTHVANFDWCAMRVDLATGRVVDYQPPAPLDNEFETHSWDAQAKRWVATPTPAAHWRHVRAERDRRLRESDWVALRALEGGPATTPAWRAYRQALRDITTQPDPLAIVWPEPPT